MSEVEEAMSSAWLAAREIGHGDREIAGMVIGSAEKSVIRRLLSSTLPGGEAEFWRLVEKELRP